MRLPGDHHGCFVRMDRRPMLVRWRALPVVRIACRLDRDAPGTLLKIRGERSMMRSKTILAPLATLATLAVVIGTGVVALGQPAAKPGGPVPTFQADPTWPPALPNNWVMG